MKTDDTPNKTSWRLKPVLSDDLLADIPLVSAWVDKIKNKKCISRIISQLNKTCPVLSLQHLKRVRGDEILIDLAVCGEDGKKESFLQKFAAMEEFTLGLSLDPYMLQVPATQPRTVAQFKSCNLIWPCNFHLNKNMEDTLSGEKFSEENLRRIESWMRKALEICNHSGVCCVVVDPDTNQLIASGVDKRHVHPMKHAAMVAIDNVAKAQNGGAWNEKCADMEGAQSDTPTIASENAQTVAYVPKDSNKNESHGPYLCTGYDVYLTAEPCLMCAMALVHSRAKRVFYGCPNSISGALGSKLKLHTVTNLNHHYEVYAGVLEMECGEAFARVGVK